MTKLVSNFTVSKMRAVKVILIIFSLFINSNSLFSQFSASAIPTGFLNGASELTPTEKEMVAEEMLGYLKDIRTDKYKKFLQNIAKDTQGFSTLFNKDTMEALKDNEHRLGNMGGITDISLVDDSIVVTGKISSNEHYRVIVRDLNYETGVATYIVSISKEEYPVATRGNKSSLMNEASAGIFDSALGFLLGKKPNEVTIKQVKNGENDILTEAEEGYRPGYGFITYAKGSTVTNRSYYYHHATPNVVTSGSGSESGSTPVVVVSSNGFTGSPSSVMKTEVFKGAVGVAGGLVTAALPTVISAVSTGTALSSLGVVGGVIGGVIAAGALAYGAYKGYQYFKQKRAEISASEKYLDIFSQLDQSCASEKNDLKEHLRERQAEKRRKEKREEEEKYLPRSLALHYLLNNGKKGPANPLPKVPWLAMGKERSLFRNPTTEDDITPYMNDLTPLLSTLTYSEGATKEDKAKALGEEINHIVTSWPYGNIGDLHLNKNLKKRNFNNAIVGCKAKLDSKVAPDGIITSSRKAYNGIKNRIKSFAGGILNFFSSVTPKESDKIVDNSGNSYATNEDKLTQACEHYVQFQACHLKIREIIADPDNYGKWAAYKEEQAERARKENSIYARKLRRVGSSASSF